MVRAIIEGKKTVTRRICKGQREQSSKYDFPLYRNPYGSPGERLWVRERCKAEELADMTDGVRYDADGEFIAIKNTPEAADRWVHLNGYSGGKGRSVPSIHMPKWASRITLEIRRIEVQRLHDMTTRDAFSEGVNGRGPFSQLWSKIHPPGPHYEDAWSLNPLVWVVAFDRI